METDRDFQNRTRSCGAEAFPLALRRLRFELRFEATGRLPRFPGSALRGLLGHGLRELSCVTGRRECAGCPMLVRCDYAGFFEPATRAREQPGAASVTAFWVLQRPPLTRTDVRAGDGLHFRLVLVGHHETWRLRWLAQAMERAARRGFGRGGIPFRLVGVEHERWLGSEEWAPLDSPDRVARAATVPFPPPPAAGELELRLQTPLRMKYRGHLLTPETLGLRQILGGLRRRLGELLAGDRGAAQCALPALPPDDSALLARRLRWQELARWSNRQQTRMQMGGVMGRMRLDRERLADWWPWLWLGQWLHLGKQTTMGLGQYRLYTSL